MKLCVTIVFLFFFQQITNAQVGWGDRVKTPREIFAIQKILDAEKALRLKRGNHRT
jgi:hypothetical protein